jgi:hypothetical protein
MSIYNIKPAAFLEAIHSSADTDPASHIYCAGFELSKWRCKQFSNHLVEWLPDCALAEEELKTDHGNAFVKLQQAAARVYTSAKYQKRGEAGEIALHAVCREFFNTIPISPRVFYKSASNDPVKSFDLVHARFPDGKPFEIWLGESKLYKNRGQAIAAAIKSIKDHIKQGFLTREKLLLGPQISKATPNYDQIMDVFKARTSLDKFLEAAVFIIGILADSDGAKNATVTCGEYVSAAVAELQEMIDVLSGINFGTPLRLMLIYVPLAGKQDLAEAFDKRLKALQ